MILWRALYTVALLIFSLITPAGAEDNRNSVIQNQMDCVDRHLSGQEGITWSDVCDIPQSFDQQHQQAVNQQLNQVEQYIPSSQPQAPVLPLPADVLPQNQKPEWTFEIAPEFSHIKYHEQVDGSDFVREFGNMGGINVDATFHPPLGHILNSDLLDVYKVQGMFNYGQVNYRGGIQYSDGTTSPEGFNGINDYMVELRGMGGKDIYFNNQSVRLTPYMGLGYRSLYDASYANKPYGYNRRIQYLYAPTGAELMVKLNNRWSLGINGEYDVFIRGFVTSYTQAIGLGNITNTQTSGYGVRGSVKLMENFGSYDIFLEPYVRFWSIHASRWDSSNIFDGNYFFIAEEPTNTSLEIGTKLGVDF